MYILPGVKSLWREADQQSNSSAQFKNACSYTVNVLYV
jgi:hypothetical protein